MEKEFKFEFSQVVKIGDSEESGKVIGRSQFLHCDNEYLVRYTAGDGRCTQVWWTESALTAL